MKIKNNPAKPLLLVLTAALCYGCGGGGNGGGASSGGKPNEEVVNPVQHNNGPKAVTISRTSVIPTNTGVGINHKLKVDNFTGANLKLAGFNISGSAQTSALGKTYDQVKKAVGGLGYDARLNLAGCETLPERGSCNIGFSPDEKNGSTRVQLIFEDENGQQHLASQLIEYSSVVNKDNGFYVSNANIDNVASTNAYSLSIPFVSDDDYDSVEVNSEVMTISKSVSCERGMKKGDFCTALVTLPAGPVNSYQNQITIRGTKADGSIRAVDLSTGNTYNDFAHLVITRGPVEINAAGFFKSSIRIVNDGVVDATNVKSDVILGSAWFNGAQSPAAGDYLKQAQTCNNQPIKLETGGHTIASGGFCDLEFNLIPDYLDATGSNNYRLVYELGATGAAPMSSTTQLYYTGRYVPEYAYALLGDVDFGDVGVKTSQSRMITVENKGTEEIHSFGVEGLPNGLELSLDTANSSCLAKTAVAALKPAEQCTLQLTYAPTGKVAKSSFQLKVKAKKAGTDPTTVINDYVEPVQERTVTYAAVETGGHGLVITPQDHGISIAANDLESRVSSIRVQNLSKTSEYVLNKLSVAKENAFPASNKLTVTGEEFLSGSEFNVNNAKTNNPFKKIALSSGTTTTPDSTNYVLKSGESGELTFVYGPVPTTVKESGLLSLVFNGGFKGLSTFDTSHVTQYRAIPGTVTVIKPVITGPDKPLVDLITGGGENAFVLTDKNYPKVKFVYQFSADTYGFVINDANLPFGWLPDANSTCPRTSDGKTSAPSTVIKKECTYVATFVDSGRLAHAHYYEAAVAQASTLRAPGYSFYSAKGTTPNGTLNVITDSGQEITINPKPFMDSAVKMSVTGKNPDGSSKIDITFTLNKINATTLKSDEVTFQGFFTKPADLNPEGTSSCTAAVGQSCTLAATLKAGVEFNLPYISSSLDNGTYNARHGSILIIN